MGASTSSGTGNKITVELDLKKAVEDELITFVLADKLAAAAWAASLLQRGPDTWCILDTETTGLREAEIIQIGVISGSGDVLLDSYVMPSAAGLAGLTPDHEAVRIHGIDADKLRELNPPTWPEVFAKLKAAIAGKLVVIYNASFDTARIFDSCAAIGAAGLASWGAVETRWHNDENYKRELLEKSLLPLSAAGYPFFDWAQLGATNASADCAMNNYAQWCGEWNYRHGSYTWKKLPNAKHNPIGDCLAVLTVIKNMAEWLPLRILALSAEQARAVDEMTRHQIYGTLPAGYGEIWKYDTAFRRITLQQETQSVSSSNGFDPENIPF